MARILLITCIASFLGGSAAAETVLVREGDLWDFDRGRQAPPANWAGLDFDPSEAGWEQGATGMGYSDADDATVIDDMMGAYMTLFLRIDVEVPAGLEGLRWILRVRYDDSFVAYLDGQEVARRGITGAPPAFDQAADIDHEITVVDGFDESIPLPSAGALLTAGWHVFSAEVHNATIGSSDLSFSAELSGWPFLVASVDPAFGPLEGGNTVAVRGEGFNPEAAARVWFGGVESSAVAGIDAWTIEARVPPGAAAGAVTVEVEDSRGRVTLPGGYRYVEPGQLGLAFDGLDSATASPFREDLDEGTFEVWLNRSADLGFTWRVILAVEGAGGGTDAFRIETRTNRLRARTWAGDTVTNLQATVALGADEWHHFAVTFSRTGRNLYFDGGPVGSDALAMTLPSSSRLRLGTAFGQGTGFLGTVASARLFAFERTAREVRRDRFARLGASADVEAAWPLDDGGGSVARDTGPNGFDLLLGASDGPEDIDPRWVSFTDFPALAVTEVSPASGPLPGGIAIEVYGTGFDHERPPRVLFGSSPSTALTVKSPWELEVEVPPGSAYGPVDVTVETPRGTILLPGAFVYEPPALYAFAREGDAWRYFLGTEAPPPDWARPEFDARTWPEGPTGIGYGDDDDATVVVMENVCLAVFARTTFEVAGRGEPIDYLRLKVRYDDGFVAYLNGEEIARRNIAGSPPAWDEAASDLHEITSAAGAFDEEIDVLDSKGRLRPGLNVLALEVHNATLDSSDLSLSAELIYSAPGTTFLRGDVDRSGSRSVLDPIRIIRWLFEGAEIACEESADVDDDGAVEITDALVLLGYLFAAGPPLAPPSARPALDLDGDPLACTG